MWPLVSQDLGAFAGTGTVLAVSVWRGCGVDVHMADATVSTGILLREWPAQQSKEPCRGQIDRQTDRQTAHGCVGR
jgi:hypothetical protein